MSPEKQRIAIAEACGWQNLREEIAYVDWVASRELWGCRREDDDMRKEVPDYPNDLNAMHEVEKTGLGKFWVSFPEQLRKVTEDKTRCPMSNEWRFTHATAAQRAEAFLKTLDLWED